MTFLKRLRYYLVGFGIGIVLSIIIFGSRGCDWTPGNRVLKQIATSQILISDSVRCVLRDNTIDEDDVFKLLNNGDVIFSESHTQAVPKTYVIENTEKNFKILFTVRNDTVSVISGVPGGKQGHCAEADTAWHIFTMPEKTIKRVLKAKEITAADSVFVKLKASKIGDGEIYNMIGAGKIDFTLSTPLSKPHPIYFVDYKNYHFTIEMAQEKTRILDFVVK